MTFPLTNIEMHEQRRTARVAMYEKIDREGCCGDHPRFPWVDGYCHHVPGKCPRWQLEQAAALRRQEMLDWIERLKEGELIT